VKIEQNLPDNCLLGKEINLVRYALTSYNIKADAEEKLFSSRFRLLIFGNFYCKPCWDNVLKWDSCYSDSFLGEDVSIICYVNAMKNDIQRFDSLEHLRIPIFLDESNRFLVVNGLSNSIERSTYLLNLKNEIVYFGGRFNTKIRAEILEILEKNRESSECPNFALP
jgi:hypothetical protein